MEITEDLAHSLLLRFVKSYLECDDIMIGKITGLPIVLPNQNIRSKCSREIGTPLLLINDSASSLESSGIKKEDLFYWTKVLILCLGNKISWYDTWSFGKSKHMSNTIEQLIIELDLIA